MDSAVSNTANESAIGRLNIEADALSALFSPLVKAPDAQTLYDAAQNLSQSDNRLQVCAATLFAGFAAPEAATEVYDIIAAGVLGDKLPKATNGVASAAPIPNAFWQAFAQVLTGPSEGYDAVSITVAVASLGAHVDPGFAEVAENAAANHPAADNPANKTTPGLVSLDELAACPEDSLANTLYRMLVDNGFDPEVLDREAIGLAELSPALRYLNTRILQMHDVWHLVAGYETTGLHEIAISSFQLAQFGHNYSGMFLSMVLCRSHLSDGLGFDILLRIICQAWQHGRTSPSFMAIEFEQDWQQSIEAVRQKYQITPFQSELPADLFEQLSAQA